MSKYMTELFYGKPEPVWVINNRRRQGLGETTGSYYGPTTAMGTYGTYGAQDYPYARGTSLLPDVTIKTPLYDLSDVARIKNVLALEGVYNVVCDIPEQTVTVSSNRSPQTIFSLIRQVMGSASIINVVDPLQPTFSPPRDRTRYSSYDDMYSYDGRTGYTPAYSAPYNGRSYDNEFRPSRYYGASGSGYSRSYY